MVDNDNRNDATANERVGANKPNESQDTTRDPFASRTADLKLAAVTLGCAVALYALRAIPLPARR
jgi:hypothetical protein